MWFLSLLLLLIIACYHYVRSHFYSSSKGSHALPPGPFAFPIIGSLHLLGSLPHQSLASLAKRYGPLMYLRLGSVPTMVVSSPSMAKEVLGTHDVVFANRPRFQMGYRIFYDHRSLALLPYGFEYRYIRKLFTSRRLLTFKPLREAEMATILHFLSCSSSPLVEEKMTNVVNLTKVLSSLATSTIMRMVISKGLPGAAEGPQASKLREMIIELFLLSGIPILADFIPCLKWVLDPNGYLKRMTKVHLLWNSFLDQLIEERRKDLLLDSRNRTGKGDFLDVLLSIHTNTNVDTDANANDNTCGVADLSNMSSIKALILELIATGTDTTVATIDWTMVELLRNPYTLERLIQELDSSVGKTRAVTLDDVANLKYLHAVVKETFRLHPPSPLLLPHLASESCNVGGYMIPKGARVIVNAWTIGRDESTWARPLEFLPTRFLDEEGNNSNIDVNGSHFELLLFGAGRRGCPAMALALTSVQFAVASLVHTFDWSYAPGHENDNKDMQEAPGLISHRAKPLLVVPRSRGVPIMSL